MILVGGSKIVNLFVKERNEIAENVNVHEGRGIYTKISVDSLHWTSNACFWLPNNTAKALEKIRMELYKNRTFTPPIPDSQCTRKVEFHLKGIEKIHLGFLAIISWLIRHGVTVELHGVE